MATLTGLTQNFFPTASETYANNLSASISALAATVPVNSANEYADGDVATITVDAGTVNEATFTGVKASAPARFTNCVWTEGNLGVGHASGATVIDYDSATHMSQVSKGILVEHKQNGQHRNINADSVTVNGSIIATGDVTEAGVTARVFRSESLFDYIASGGVWSGIGYGANLNAAMTAVSVYQAGYRGTIAAIASRAFTANKDTYVDILRTTVGAVTTFTIVYTEVANNAASPPLAANSVRLAIIVTGAASIAAVGSINQGQNDKVLPISGGFAYTLNDSLGNRICRRNPSETRRAFGSIQPGLPVIPAAYTTYINKPMIVQGRSLEIEYGCNIKDGSSGSTRTGRVRLLVDGATPVGDLIWQTISSGVYGGIAHHMISLELTPGLHTIALQVSADTASASTLQSAYMLVNEA